MSEQDSRALAWEHFVYHLGKVVAKNVARQTAADWRRGALSTDSPCYTDYNLTWLHLATGVGSPGVKQLFEITKAELR